MPLHLESRVGRDLTSLHGSKPRSRNYRESKPAETWRSCSFEEAGGEQGAEGPPAFKAAVEETQQFRESTKEAAAARAGALHPWGNLVWEERQGRRSTDRLGNANGSPYLIGKLRQGAAWACLFFPLSLRVCHAKNDAVWTLYNAWLCPRGQEPESQSIRTAGALSQGLRKRRGEQRAPAWLLSLTSALSLPGSSEERASAREPCCDSLAAARAATRETW